MQCSMRNQYNDLFTCIIDYLHVLYMILIVWICVLCMTLIMFIYMYYGLFAYTNLVELMLLFSTIFLSSDQFSGKFGQFLPQFVRESSE
jgi:hypothetical protein